MAKNTKKSARKSWFDSHVIVMGPDSEMEDKVRQTLKEKVCKSIQNDKEES